MSRATCSIELEQLWHRDIWDDRSVNERVGSVAYRQLLCIGGGLGTFTVVDFLRIAGVSTARIGIVSPQLQPHSTFAYLCSVSQLAPTDPMRSDSMSRIDNIWGWPSYALEDAIRRRRIKPLWQVLTEPLLSEFYNPTVADVCAGIEREAARISWSDMLVCGRAIAVRRRADGGYFVVVDQGEARSAVYRCDFVHLAVGYPALRLLPDVQRYRERFPGDRRIGHTYEPHEHVYEALVRKPGTVLVRGSGIAASRVLQRLVDDRDTHDCQTRIVHLFRNYTDGPKGPRTFRRPGGDGFTYQPFTFPKASGGGQLRDRTLRRSRDERAAFVTSMGGTTTAHRKAWARQLARGRAEGWYRPTVGEVRQFDRGPEGRVAAEISTREGTSSTVAVDYVIDATGLDPDIRGHALLADLLDRGGAQPNALGRLDVDVDFEVRGTRSGSGRVYASGSCTLGGYLAPVDSFWGLSHAALEISDSLARSGFCRRIGFLRSAREWFRWVTNTQL